MIAGAPEVQIPIRVRGMSQGQRFFDEQTSTSRVTQDFIVILLRDMVDLDSELHITSMQTQVGGTFRVAWINARPAQDFYHVGLELLDPEGEIWEPESIQNGPETGDAAPVVLLECVRCHQTVSTSLPEAKTESLGEGFTIARHCDTCKATTGWAYRAEKPSAAGSLSEEATSDPEASAEAGASSPTSGESSKDQRLKGRAPIRLPIKIVRNKYGRVITDVCETINVSRTGVYFTSDQRYEVGETVEVIMPYDPDGVAIPVQAQVVRQDERPGTYQKRIAIQLTSGATLPR
jgi:hypothetical protein